MERRHEADGDEIVVGALVEEILLHRRARGNHLDDVALHDSLARARVGELLAHGYPLALLEQAGDVRPRRVIGNAAHGHALAVRKREVEEGAGLAGILEEHLVEIAEPEEEDRVAVPRLDRPVLIHHGNPLGHGVALYRRRS
jgi:hypothetical protein